MIPPLCLIQARLTSTRIEHKMLLDFGGETLIARAWRWASSLTVDWQVTVALPAGDAESPLDEELRGIGASVNFWDGPEWDVLGRLHAIAHRYRWHPDSIIHRWTPDDPFKDGGSVRAVLKGMRLPVELGGEAFTLGMLDAAHALFPKSAREYREHVTDALFPSRVPLLEGEGWTIDDEASYQAALKRLKTWSDR